MILHHSDTRRETAIRSPLRFLIPLSLMALAACETAPTGGATATAPKSSTLQRSATAGPGEATISGARAAQYFNALCGSAPQGRSALEAAAAANGFVQNTRTTTYYHPVDDLSVKLTDTTCSIVFSSNSSATSVQSSFAALGGETGDAFVRPRGQNNSKNYFSAGIWLG